ncbi:MAG: hypothetical protein LBP35_06895 [Candidatus Ancillula trichonymphae]|jgi:hypothetical protein|nr:hypothetical protein [Candidatus Ancillula trichonymphae]
MAKDAKDSLVPSVLQSVFFLAVSVVDVVSSSVGLTKALKVGREIPELPASHSDASVPSTARSSVPGSLEGEEIYGMEAYSEDWKNLFGNTLHHYNTVSGIPYSAANMCTPGGEALLTYSSNSSHISNSFERHMRQILGKHLSTEEYERVLRGLGGLVPVMQGMRIAFGKQQVRKKRRRT